MSFPANTGTNVSSVLEVCVFNLLKKEKKKNRTHDSQLSPMGAGKLLFALDTFSSVTVYQR